MVENGDESKPIWITEMNWNSPPADFPNKQFGYVTPEQQAEYAVLAYERAQQEWPWLGVVNVWFFKRATDTETDQPMYYFRLVEPDFSPMPIYHSLKEYFTSDRALVLYPGVYQEDHWALAYEGQWESRPNEAAELGGYRLAHGSQDTLSLTFDGTELWLRVGPGFEGSVSASVDGNASETMSFVAGEQLPLASSLARGQHTISIHSDSGLLTVDSLTIRQGISLGTWLLGGVGVVVVVLALVVALGVISRRRHWYERSRAGR
jgi:hypothetical protein